jgi:hypothetical protein
VKIPLPHLSAQRGEEIHLELREPTVEEFFLGAPESAAKPGPLSLDEHVDGARWEDAILERCGDVAAADLGPDRDHVVREMLAGWRRRDLPEFARKMLRILHEQTGRLPSELSRLPISDFFFNRSVFQADGKPRGKAGRVLAMNDPELLEAEEPDGR